MGRLNSKTRKTVRQYSDRAIGSAETAKRLRDDAAIKEANKNSIENQTRLARAKCIQLLYKPESEYELLIKKGVVDVAIIEESQRNIIKNLDIAAIKTAGRLLAEIKTKALNLKEMIDIKLTEKDFYNNFENFYQKNFGDYSLSNEDFENIIKLYTANLDRINSLGRRVLYVKPAKKLEYNIDYIKNAVVKENDLTI